MLSLAELQRAAQALEARVCGHRVEKIVQDHEHRIVFTFYGRRGDGGGVKTHVLFSCCPRLGRVSEVERPPTAPERPLAFCSYLRARLGGARVRDVRIVGGDRQLALRFEAREGDFELLVSLLGNRSNLYLVDGEGTLLAALRPLEQTRRTLRIGSAWEDPPPQPGPARRADVDRFAESEAPDVLTEIESHYCDRETERDGEQLAQQLAKVLRKERKQAQRRLDRIEAELAEADQVGDLQRQGDLLKSVLGRIRQGDSQVVARDYETGEEVTLPLDPKRSPKENLDHVFKRYQKLVRRLTKAGGQVDEARAQCTALEALDAELADLRAGGEASTEALESFAARPLVAKGLGRRTRTAAAAGLAAAPRPELPARLRGLPRKLVPRRYQSADGLEIWVGRNDEGNDYLTTRLARGNDLFFHLDGAPGSHVILRTGGKVDPPNESVLDACELAVRFSKQKNAGRADVHVVPIKQVKKPKGAKPGLVWVTGGRSIHLRRDEKRLARVLGARIED